MKAYYGINYIRHAYCMWVWNNDESWDEGNYYGALRNAKELMDSHFLNFFNFWRLLTDILVEFEAPYSRIAPFHLRHKNTVFIKA